MNLTDEQGAHIAQIGVWLLSALEEIVRWADMQLNRDPPGIDSTLPETARLSIARSLAEGRQSVELLRREPAIARLVVEWQQPSQENTTFLVCRGAAAGAPAIDGVLLASYRSPVGRLAEHEPGELATVRLRGTERTARITERQQWRPRQTAGLWDAEDCAFELQTWQAVITSIRRFIEEAQRPAVEAPLEAIYAAAERAENVLLERRRRAIDRIALRDQPILDRHQGEVFRMPLDRRVLLIGPPGTGKTTTLIKRIAQKQTLSELPAEEVELVTSLGLAERFSGQDGWAMFSPTELLMLYLRDAFNREGVPASGHQLRTWQRERRHLARNVIPILRTETRGRFREEATACILPTPTSQSLSELHDAFTEFHLARVTERCQDAVDAILQSTEEESQELIALLRGSLRLEAASTTRHIQRLFPTPPLLRTVVNRIEEETKEWTDREANRILRARPTLLNQLRPLLYDDDQAQEDAEEDAESDDDVLRGNRFLRGFVGRAHRALSPQPAILVRMRRLQAAYHPHRHQLAVRTPLD